MTNIRQYRPAVADGSDAHNYAPAFVFATVPRQTLVSVSGSL